MLHEPVARANSLPAHHIDELTGFANRAWLNQNLPEAIKLHSGEVGVLFIDLDGLKAINDSEGHDAGDKLIVDSSNTINDSIRQPHEDRPGDMVGRIARLGGDELVVLLIGVKTEEDLLLVQARIRENLESNSLGASLGGALHSGEVDDTASELLGRADRAMYAEKEARKKAKFDELPRRKRFASKAGGFLLRYAGVNPPRQ